MLNDNKAPGRPKAGLFYQGRWSEDLPSEMIQGARGQTPEPPVDGMTWLELLKEVCSNPGARHRSAVSTAITPHRWDTDQRPQLFFSHVLGMNDKWGQL